MNYTTVLYISRNATHADNQAWKVASEALERGNRMEKRSDEVYEFNDTEATRHIFKTVQDQDEIRDIKPDTVIIHELVTPEELEELRKEDIV